MTNEGLTRILEIHPTDLQMVANGYEAGYDDLEGHLITMKEIRLDAGGAWWEGQHRDWWNDRRVGSAVVDIPVLKCPTKQAGY